MKGFGDKVPIFKNQLIEYAQKSGLPSPVYNIIKEGPEHERRYKAIVVIDNETYESPTYHLNLKKAEHAAAEVALAAIAAKSGKISAVPNPLHESGLCKNILQQYAQKCHYALPIYTFVKSGETHSPLFNGSVKIGGVTYTGGISKSKKEAEIKAAKTALIAICSDPDKPPLEAFTKQPPEAAVGSCAAKAKAKKRRHKKQTRSAHKKLKSQPIDSTSVTVTSNDEPQRTSPNTLTAGISPSDPEGGAAAASHGEGQTSNNNIPNARISPIHPNASALATAYGGARKTTVNMLNANIAPSYPNGSTFLPAVQLTGIGNQNPGFTPVYQNGPPFITGYGGVQRTVTLNAGIAPIYPVCTSFVPGYSVPQRPIANTLNVGIHPSFPHCPTFVSSYAGAQRISPSMLNACVLPSYNGGSTFVTRVQRTGTNTLNIGIVPTYPTFVPNYGGVQRTRNF